MRNSRSHRRVAGLFAAVVLAGLVAVLPAAQKDDQAEVFLQSAQHKQLVDGDLEGAIQQYKAIVANFGSDRPVAAKALVEMGECYEKLGQAEARKTYERVLRDYADQNEAVAEARARLATLAHPANSTDGSAMVTSRVWAGSRADMTGGVSADGRYLSFVDWETGDLAVRDLTAGENRRLTRKGSWADSPEYAWTSVPSPDGKQVVYAWVNKDGSSDLRLVGVDGSAPRVLVHSEEVPWQTPAAWSPDGKYILATFMRKDRTNQIVVLSASDGSFGVLKTLDWRSPSRMTFSPDGRYIAYDYPPNADSPNRDIFVLATDGSRETPLVQHPANDVLCCWTPDGEKVLFSSDRTGTISAWAIGVVEGKPQGPPEVVKADMGRISPLGVTRKGSLYYGAEIRTMNVYVAGFDPASGEVVSSPTRAIEQFIGSNASPAWSPDGRSLAYVSYRFLGHTSNTTTTVLAVHSFAAGEDRDLPSNLNYVNGPSWAPDGRSLIIRGRDNKGRSDLYQINVDTGETSPLLQADAGDLAGNPFWSPDGKKLYYQKGRTHIMVRDMATGQEKEVYGAFNSRRTLNEFALSADGQKLALMVRDEAAHSVDLGVIPASGGVPRDILKLNTSEAAANDLLAWTPDGKWLIFGKLNPSRLGELSLWRIASEGGEPHKLGVAMSMVRNLRVRPDGLSIAFTAGNFGAEIWVMENFLPLLKASR